MSLIWSGKDEANKRTHEMENTKTGGWSRTILEEHKTENMEKGTEAVIVQQDRFLSSIYFKYCSVAADDITEKICVLGTYYVSN